MRRFQCRGVWCWSSVSSCHRRLAGSGSGYLTAAVAARVSRALRRAVAPVYLRRNQEDVLTELPDRIEVEDWVQLSPADDAAHRDAVRSRNLMAMRQAAFHAAESAKLERLHEIVAESDADGLKVLVFSYFLDVLDSIVASVR